ncbi:MAG: helix-turn-helix domain-containing protein [Firmicutes bacterium]|nr:helix-turn-helix transcriptional regulator [Alicyclobacillaceae bacterium]MCL6497593.1 helix-turn-helix domain-containing protein [Bacillota bacterium]
MNTDAEARLRLGSYLRALRRRRGMSLAAVAKAAGMSPSYLSRLERGTRRPPGPDRLRRLSHILGVEAGQVLAAAGYTDPDGQAHEPPVPYGLNPSDWAMALALFAPEDWEDIGALIQVKLARLRRRAQHGADARKRPSPEPPRSAPK